MERLIKYYGAFVEDGTCALQDALTCALYEFLAEGPQPATDCKALAQGLGAGEASLRKAKANLGIVSVRQGRRWLWRLPDEGDFFLELVRRVVEDRWLEKRQAFRKGR